MRRANYFFFSRSRAVSAAGALGYLATRVSSERLAAPALPISCWQVAIASQASRAFGLSAYLVVTTLCASMARLQSRWAYQALPSQYWAFGASWLSGYFCTKAAKPAAASLYFAALNWLSAASYSWLSRAGSAAARGAPPA